MTTFPDYVRQMLVRARDMGQYYCGQPDAAALCFDVLALFPDCREASDLVYELYCDEWLIYDNRTAVQQNIDEWDDRPWQQRRRLALSFRFMSRWKGWDRDVDLGRNGPADVRPLLKQGHGLLIEAYCLGDDECTDYAWPIFMRAIAQARDPQMTMLGIAQTYADLGFFADSVEVLLQLCSQSKSEDARRLLAEVRWWRDNAHRIPWIPPTGDGSRYRHMMQFIDPNAPSDDEAIRALREKAREHGDVPTVKPVIDPELVALFGAAMPPEKETPAPALVDWSFLDTDDGQPGEPPEWAKKNMRLFRKHADKLAEMYRWTRPIPPPTTPKKRDPNEPPFDPSVFLGGEGGPDDDEDDDDEDFEWDEDEDEDEEE